MSAARRRASNGRARTGSKLRARLRFQAKHHGYRRAEQARRLMLWAMRLRGLIFRGDWRRLSREAASYFAGGDKPTLLDTPT